MVSEPVKANDGQKTVPPNALTRSGALHLLQWAWDELNVRPHAYQASVGHRRSPARCRFSFTARAIAPDLAAHDAGMLRIEWRAERRANKRNHFIHGSSGQ